MDFLVITSSSGEALTGNRCTARQWAALLREMGHEVLVVDTFDGEDASVLIALHGARNHAAVAAFRQAVPPRKIVVALTGTDVYPQPTEETLDSLRMADRVVALQPRVRDRIPAEFHEKLRIIVQSARAPATVEPIHGFDVCVVGHLRDVKDPLRAAAASHLLPETSKIRIRHAGAILEPSYHERVEREQAENARYAWLGELSASEAQQLMAQSRLQVVSSIFEGGSRVIGESIVAGTPVLAARNDASCSLLGEDYPGLYDAGDTRQLADLMARAETDRVFLDSLRDRTQRLAAQFDPRREREAWRELVAELQ